MKPFTTYLNEQKAKLVLAELPYKRTDLDPAMSKDTLDYHYGKLAKGYVDRYNKGEGDLEFNKAGAFLHNLFFPQFKPYIGENELGHLASPQGKIADFIDQHYDSFNKVKTEVEDVAMKIQGSGWVYLATDGKIKTIVNHEIRNDVVLLIDWWEHAWALDYQSEKKKYLSNIWNILNWDIINERL